MEFSQQEYWIQVAIPFSRGSSHPRDQTQVSRIAGRFFLPSEPPENVSLKIFKNKTFVLLSVSFRFQTKMFVSAVCESQTCLLCCDQLLSHVQLIVAIARQSVHGILQARILEWVAIPPGHLPNPGIKPRSPALQVDSLPSEPPTGGCQIPINHFSVVFHVLCYSREKQGLGERVMRGVEQECLCFVRGRKGANSILLFRIVTCILCNVSGTFLIPYLQHHKCQTSAWGRMGNSPSFTGLERGHLCLLDIQHKQCPLPVLPQLPRYPEPSGSSAL